MFFVGMFEFRGIHNAIVGSKKGETDGDGSGDAEGGTERNVDGICLKLEAVWSAEVSLGRKQTLNGTRTFLEKGSESSSSRICAGVLFSLAERDSTAAMLALSRLTAMPPLGIQRRVVTKAWG